MVGILVFVLCVAFFGIATWYSINQLDLMAARLERWHRWLQLRIKARKAALLAYRAAWQAVIQEGVAE